MSSTPLRLATYLACTKKTNKRTVMFPFHSIKAEYVLSHSLLHLRFVCTRTRWACLPMCQLVHFLLTMIFYVIVYYCLLYVIKLLTLRERAKGEPVSRTSQSHKSSRFCLRSVTIVLRVLIN